MKIMATRPTSAGEHVVLSQSYASDHGKILTGAVADLLDRGLNAASDERSIGELEANLARVKAAKAEAEAELQAAAI